jgi:ribonuclease HII
MNLKTAAKKTYEEAAWKNDQVLIGIDEVGRGALAGPVVIGVVRLFPNAEHPLLIDSKMLTEQQRAKMSSWIKANSFYSTIIFNERIIDKHNIYQATKRAMYRAIFQITQQLKREPEIIILDAMPLVTPFFGVKTAILSPFRAEQESISVAAASIIAKHTRDRVLTRLGLWCKNYTFPQHKGYGTMHHRDQFETHGPTIFHRNSFSFHSKTKAVKQKTTSIEGAL